MLDFVVQDFDTGDCVTHLFVFVEHDCVKHDCVKQDFVERDVVKQQFANSFV